MHCQEWFKQNTKLAEAELELEYLKQEKKVCEGKLSLWFISWRILVWKKYIKKLKKRIAYIEEHEKG